MPKAKKEANGNYRIRVYDYQDAQGKQHYKSFTARTKKQAEQMAMEYELSKKNFDNSNNKDVTVYEGLDIYIKSKEGSLSPTTITNYKSMKEHRFEYIKNILITELKTVTVQKWIGSLNETLSPKSVANTYGLFSAMIDTLYPDKKYRIKLPQKEAKTLYVPTDSDIKTLISYFKESDRDMYIACLLAAFCTMRRSEICALTASDVDGNYITVNKAKVRKNGNDKEWVIKSTKNPSSNRTIEMPEFVTKELPTNGELVSISPSLVSFRFQDAFSKLDIRKFRFHDLRHYSASIMHAIGVPDVYIMQRGGWASDHTLKNIYRGSMDDFQKKFTDLTNNHFTNMTQNMT